jgi:hypothetical protein
VGEANEARFDLGVSQFSELTWDIRRAIETMLKPHLPAAIKAVLDKAREEAALAKQQLDAAERTGKPEMKVV